MGSSRTLQPVRASRLSWIAPATISSEEFAPVRERLEKLVTAVQADEVYSAKRRSIFRVEDEVLGPLAIKEMRNEGAMRALWFRTVRARDALREFRIGSAFRAAGGSAPEFFGAALDRGPFSLRRVLLFIRWLEGVETLTGYLSRLGDPPAPEVLDKVADALIDAARLGLVHGRHSSENILVGNGARGPTFYTIDFAYSRLTSHFDAAGFARDTARIAHWLWHERVYSDATLARFFDHVARRAWADEGEARARAVGMAQELERWKAVLEKGSAGVQVRRERTT